MLDRTMAMTRHPKHAPPPGAWETIRTAIASAPRATRRTLAALWGAGAVMVAVQFTFDFGGFYLPLEVAEAIGVTLGALGMGSLGSVLVLQTAQQRAAGEARAVWAETKTPTQIVLVLPLAAAAGGAALAAAIGITVVRALLGSPEHYVIAAFMAAYLVVVGRIIFGATRSLYVYGRRQSAAAERARAEVAEARMQALQAQMNPHFLFNTLNTVASLVRRDPTSAEQTVEHLSSVLRRTLDRSSRRMSTVADEVDYVRAYLVVVGRIIFGATRALYVYGRRQSAAAERARAEVAEARMQALQAQMNPHFLFNTLNTVASLVRRDPTSAERTVEHLSSVLRRTLDRSSRPMSTVADEVDYVRAYFAIEQQRFGNRLQVEWHVDSWARSRTLPTMTLQPLVENAVKHGIGNRLDGGAIRIAISEVGEGLRIIVEDDGPGFASPHRDGTGLGNLRQRLQTQYAGVASLRIEHPPMGARVVVDLPPAPPLGDES